jgi:signal transduction histidine kinase
MVPPKGPTPSDGRQFRLVKFFASASFIVLIIFSFPYSVVISQRAKDILMMSYENYARLLGENLNHQVFQNFVLPVTEWLREDISLREQKQYEWMDRIVKNTIHSFNIDLVNIYETGSPVIAYSTDPNLIGKQVKESAGYRKAVAGEDSSGLVSEGDALWGLGIERLGDEKKLRTYIPFLGIAPYTGQKFVIGVFELIQDLTQEYRSIVKLQYVIFGLSILIMGLIFVALLLIVHKAEGIIEQRAKEQRELESQLNHAERLAALGQMVAGVSHEVRNPLGIIRSTAELMGGMPDATETQQKLSGVIIQESSRLNNIVTEFLDFARPQKPNFQECYLEDIIQKNLQFLQPEFEKENITVHDNLNGRSFKLSADPQMLYRAFLNLFINGIQAMENGGRINVEVGEEKDHFVVGIEDTGSGISEENLKKIFDPFFSTKDKGSGLGISIVRNIVEGHKGSIWIESKDGAGTKVFMRLPREQ